MIFYGIQFFLCLFPARCNLVVTPFVFNVNLRVRLCISLFLRIISNNQSIMPKLIAFILFAVFLSSVTLGQTAQVVGKTADTAEKKNLANSSILLLRKADSILVAHTRSNATGDFRLSKLPGGHYLILATYPGYADYVDTL